MVRYITAISLVISLSSCVQKQPPKEDDYIGSEAYSKGAYLDRLVLPETEIREGRKHVALRLNSKPPSPAHELTYFLFRKKNDLSTRKLHFERLGYKPIRLSHEAGWDKVFTVKNRDIVPMGQELYRFTFADTDQFVTLERVTDALADRFTLSDDCDCLFPNIFEPRLMAEEIGKGRFSDVVRFDEFRPGDNSVVITLLPTVSSDRGQLPQLIWERETHILKPGETWKARSYSYQTLSVVPPQDILEGHVVGWIELRLK